MDLTKEQLLMVDLAVRHAVEEVAFPFGKQFCIADVSQAVKRNIRIEQEKNKKQVIIALAIAYITGVSEETTGKTRVIEEYQQAYDCSFEQAKDAINLLVAYASKELSFT